MNIHHVVKYKNAYDVITTDHVVCDLPDVTMISSMSFLLGVTVCLTFVFAYHSLNAYYEWTEKYKYKQL